MNDLPPLMRPEILAPLLGMTEAGVRGLIRRGALPASRIGRRWIVRRDAFIAFLERQERANRAPTTGEAEVARILRALPAPRRRPVPLPKGS